MEGGEADQETDRCMREGGGSKQRKHQKGGKANCIVGGGTNYQEWEEGGGDK